MRGGSDEADLRRGEVQRQLRTQETQEISLVCMDVNDGRHCTPDPALCVPSQHFFLANERCFFLPYGGLGSGQGGVINICPVKGVLH